MAAPSDSDAEVREAAEAYGGPAYRWYVLGVLVLVVTCHSMDRALPFILVEPVREEFNLTDAQLGLFTGSYGIAIALGAVPMAWIADRVNRKHFLAAILTVWSLLTVACGLTRNYVQLLASRVGVGLAESGGTPTMIPMVSDIFPQRRRALAIGIYSMAIPLGLLAANVMGGFMAANFGWREAFFVGGIPGLLICLLLLLTVREPKRGGSDGLAQAAAGPPPRKADGFKHYLRNPGLLLVLIGCITLGLVNIISNTWSSSFFVRVHGASLEQTGLILGLGGGAIGILGPLMYGALTSHLTTYNRLWSTWIVVVSALLSMAFLLLQLFTPVLWISAGAYTLAEFTRSFYSVPLYAVLMDNSPPGIRSSVMAVQIMAVNLVGYGLGPPIIGLLSDLFGGGTNIRYALASSSVLYLVAAGVLLAAGRMLFGRWHEGRVAPTGASA